MNPHAAPGPGLVALVGLTSPDADYARETVTVAGARLCEDPSRAPSSSPRLELPFPRSCPACAWAAGDR